MAVSVSVKLGLVEADGPFGQVTVIDPLPAFTPTVLVPVITAGEKVPDFPALPPVGDPPPSRTA
jgi:hypothetical protein